ncbi:MAG: M28 family peptidase, partial [Candidatus Thorarchaeota archaeon]
KFLKKYTREFFRAYKENYLEASQTAFKTIEHELDENEKEYLKFFVESFKDFNSIDSWIGGSAVIGSTKWVEQALLDKKEIIGVLNLETIGYSSKMKGSQKSPSPIFKILPKYKVNLRKGRGDFIAIAGDKNSLELAKIFCKQCKKNAINLPYLNAALPFNYQFLAKYARDLLRSDNAPFQRVGIPAVMITDTANFRYPYYHTEADTIDKLDFEFIKKVTQATIATSLIYK